MYVYLQYAPILLFQALRHAELGPPASFPQQEGTFLHTHVMTFIWDVLPGHCLLGSSSANTIQQEPRLEDCWIGRECFYFRPHSFTERSVQS